MGIVDKGAVNVNVQVLGYVFFSCEKISKSRIIGSYDEYLFILQILSPK